MRIDKFLSNMGFGSRKEVKILLKKQEVLVNGKRIKDGKFSVNEKIATVKVSGEIVEYQEFYYYLLHKPKGVISATEDGMHRTVLDLLRKEDYRTDIFPVGRLDKDTTGLLLLTNDGQLSHELLSPKKHVAKRYWALISGIVTSQDGEAFKEGIILSGDEECQPAHLEIISVDTEKSQSYIRLTITEGKYHQVKRMFEEVGKKVLELHRESMGALELDEDLKRGDYRALTSEEIEKMKGT